MANIVTLKDYTNEVMYPQTTSDATYTPTGTTVTDKLDSLDTSFGASVFTNSEIMVGYILSEGGEVINWNYPTWGLVKMHLAAGTYRFILPGQNAYARPALCKFTDDSYSGSGTTVLGGQYGERDIYLTLEAGYYAMSWYDEDGTATNPAGARVIRVDGDIISTDEKVYNPQLLPSKTLSDKLIHKSSNTPVIVDGYALSVSSSQDPVLYFNMTPAADCTLLVFNYDGKSKYFRFTGLTITEHTYIWYMAKWGIWEYTNYRNLVRLESRDQMDMTGIESLGVVAIEYRKSEQLDFVPENFKIEWTGTAAEKTLASDYNRVEIEKDTVVDGEFWAVPGRTIPNANMKYVTYPVSGLKQYAVTGFGYPSAGYTGIQEIHFFRGDLWLGWELYIARGPMEQTDDYMLLEIPPTCDSIAVNVQNYYIDSVKLYEVSAGKPIALKGLEDRVEELENNPGHQGATALNTIVKRGSHIYARTSFNETQDLVVDYLLFDNHNYTWRSAYLGTKEATLDEILGNGPVHSMGDSTAPLCITSPAPWHLWTQHGYCIPYLTVASHSLTQEDIGSVWKDQRDRRYKIGNFSSTYIYLLPEIQETEYPGVYTRSWKSPAASNPEITTLTHVSGATHTSTITPITWASTQLRPMMTLKKRTLLADGTEVTKDGIYQCNEFIISETLECTDPWSVETWWPVTQVEVGAELTQNFTISGLGHRFDVILNMKKPYIFSWYGANQVQHLVPISTMDGYDVYAMIPRSKLYDYPYLASDTTRSGEPINNNSTSLRDLSKHPDRFITFFKNEQGDMPLGCASGLSIVRGTSKDSNRQSLASANDQLLSISPSNNNKAYFKLIQPSKFDHGILPASFICNISTYLCYFDPKANAGQVYWYKDGNAYMVYAHYQTAQDKTAIVVAPQMEGLSVEVVDKTPGVTLLTEIVDNQNIYVSADSANNNYIVMRLS